MNNMHHHHMAHAPWYGTTPMQPFAQPGAYPMGPYGPGMPAGGYPFAAMQMAAPSPVAPPSANILTNPRFIKGVLIGAVAAYLLTNENVQQATIKSAVKVWSMVQGGVEEMKERFRDAEAELHVAQEQETE